ncbi:MAG TPA: hypothetical protein VF444_22840 [Pseudonocardiaceae bacterium]
MPRPFVAYLRVYEPLSAFTAEVASRLRQRAETRPLSRAAMGDRERELWLRSQSAIPARSLPGELANGVIAPNAPIDVLVLDPSDVPVHEPATVGPGPLLCPLDLRLRSAAALAGFLGSNWGALLNAAVVAPVEELLAHTSAVMAEERAAAVHVISSTWTVPLPWFALIDPADRRMVLGTRDDPDRQVLWRAAMADARRRVSRAFNLTRNTLGEEGPAELIRDTGRWLEQFHPHSAIELDYGGLVQLLSDEELIEDTAAQDVHDILAAMDSSDAERIADRYARLREFWGDLAARERDN